MPYVLIKKGTGYVVRNLETGQEFSKKPLPKMRAEAQLRVLQLLESGMLRFKKDRSRK
jgi:hypothetical protein